MKQIAIVSGKGGTGKTVIAASFAFLAAKGVIVDCDVDAANLYILLHPEKESKTEFKGSKVAKIDDTKCAKCGICESVCRFDAISQTVVDPIACEGCEVCFHACPENAIAMKEKVDGEWYVSRTKYGPFVHAQLGAGRPNSGKLVSLIKQIAMKIVLNGDYNHIIIDGPPGMGCPVISALSGVDIALIVTEPSLSGLHDMERVIQVANHFQVKSAICINKFDLNVKMSQKIERYSSEKRIPILGKIPFDRVVQESVAQCVPVVEFENNGVSMGIKNVWSNLLNLLSTK